MDSISSFAAVLRDMLFDVLAYITPASIFLASMLYLTREGIGGTAVQSYLDLATTFDKVLVAAFCVVLLYTVGQLLTVLSTWIVWWPLGKLAGARKTSDWYYSSAKDTSEQDSSEDQAPTSVIDLSEPWYVDYQRLKSANVGLSLEVEKRVSRMMMARNNALVFLLLMPLSLAWEEAGVFVGSVVLFGVSLFDAYVQRLTVNKWFTRIVPNLDTIDKKGES